MYAMIHSAEAHHNQRAIELQAAATLARRRGNGGPKGRHGVGRLGQFAGRHLRFLHTAEPAAGAR